MEIVIDITEHEKSVIDRYVDGHGYSYKDLTRTTVIEALAQAVHKGIVLPKVHGDLIDANKLRCENADFDTYNDYCIMFDEIDNALPIVPTNEAKDD